MESPPPFGTIRHDDGPRFDQDAETVTEWKGFRLSSFQIRSIAALRAGKSVLVSAPTGAGKTLIAEYAIADAVRRGKRCVYTAPIKALSNQKYRDFRDDPEIDVGLMTGDVTIHPHAQVLIMTTEILRNSILEAPENLHDVDYVIFDEIHFMDDAERGSVWEESLIFAPEQIRFIALSATIQNLDQLGAWIGEIRPHDLAVVQSTHRPVPLDHRLNTSADGLFPSARLDYVRRKAEREGRGRDGGRGGKRHGRRQGGRRGRGDRGGPGGRDRDDDGLRPLFDKLQHDGLLPALVFSFSRKDCEHLALRSRHRELLDAEERARMQALQEELIELFQLDRGELDGRIFQLALHGVGYHHAGMLPIHKEVVERMFTSGLLKLLFTTETFALGINMPARTVVFASLRKFDGVGFDYLRTRDYLQMAGRAGRQGIDERGLVISNLDDRALLEAPIHRMHTGKPEPVTSRFRLNYASILHLFGVRGREGLQDAWEKSFDRYQHRAGSKKARERNRRIQRALVDRHLALLDELHFLDLEGRTPEERLTPRGRLARMFYGYELQITELLFRGAFEGVSPQALATVFVGLVYENRRRHVISRAPAKLFGGVRRHVDQIVRSLTRVEAQFQIPTPLKECDWGLTEAVDLWFRGASFDDLEEDTGFPGGDLCRTFRMGLQLMRHTRRALDRGDELAERLGDAIDAINSREVDARHQLELG